MFLSILTWLWSLSGKQKLMLAGFIAFVGFGLYVGYLTHKAKVAEKKAKAEAAEAERLRQQNEGMKIISNTANIAVEVENEKKIANQQAINSNVANNNYVNSRGRDSSQSSNSLSEARRRFCEEFPTDSKCR